MASPTAFTLVSAIDEDSLGFGGRIGAALASLGNISLYDITVGKQYSPTTQDQKRVTILYDNHGGQAYGAVGLELREGYYLTLDDSVSQWAIAHPTLQPIRILDLSSNTPRTAISEAVLVVYTQATRTERPVVARNVSGAGIAANASGVVTLLGTAGITAQTITITNVTDRAWANTAEGYAVFDRLSGTWLGFPTCC